MTPIARYELLERIGIGGMAEIYRARAVERDRVRIVCVKKILAHLSEDPEYRQMFTDEARVASSLHHPNVVQVLDIGRIDDQLFLALEFVDGADLGEILLRARERNVTLPLAASLHIAIEVLKGLHYAHSRRDADGRPMAIVHRDVSPGNVLLSREGAVKLGDFGIARAAVRAGRTVAGVVKGNALYMAPEQITGRAMDVRTDVYGAGLLLLTLLCGRHPYEREPLPKLIDVGVTADVPDPSSINPAVPKEVDVIVARATELDPGVRYQTAMEFGMAIEAFARGRGILLDASVLPPLLDALLPARRPPEPEADRPITYVGPIEPIEIETNLDAEDEGGTRISLYRTYVGTLEEIPGRPGATTAAIDATGEATAEGTRVSARALDAGAPESTVPSAQALAPARDAREPVPASASPAAPSDRGTPLDGVTRTQVPQLGGAPPARPSRLKLAVPPPPSQRPTATPPPSPPEPTVLSAPAAPQAIPASVFADPEVRHGSTIIGGHRQAVSAVAFSAPDCAVSAGFDQMLRVWDLPGAREMRGFRAHSAAIISLAVSRNGALCVTASRDKSLRIWETMTGTLVRTLLGHSGWVFAGALTPDSSRIVSGSQDRTVRVWDVEGRELAVLSGHGDTVVSVAVLPDGRHAISGSYDRTVRLWDLDLFSPLRVIEAGDSVRAVAVLPDGARVLSAGADKRVTIWDLANGSVIDRLHGHTEPVVALAVSPDGALALSGSYDGTVRLWETDTGRAVAILRGHTDPVTGVAFHPDGRSALSGSADGTLRFWSL